MTSFYWPARPYLRIPQARSLWPMPRRRGAQIPFFLILSFVAHPSFSWQAPVAHGLAQLLQRDHVAGESLAVGKLGRAIAPLGVQEIQQTRGSALVGVLADIPGILGLFQI